MHFEFTVSLGNLITLATIVFALIRIDRRLATYDVEHEILVGWYCQEHHIRRDDLPTRTRDRRNL